MPSWQSIIGERYTFPSRALIPRGVREPLLVGSFGGEIPVDEVVRRWRDLALVRAVAPPSGNTGDQPVLAHDPADHLLRDTRPERGLDAAVPVPAPGIGERPRHAGAQPGVLADAEPRVVVVVAAGRDTAASMSATSANTSASAGRPASSSPGSTGAAGRRPGLFLRPRPPPASTRSPAPAPVSADAAHPGHRPTARYRFRPEAWHPSVPVSGAAIPPARYSLIQ